MANRLRRARASKASGASSVEATGATPPARPFGIVSDPARGVNLVGYLEAEMGLGEAARKLGRAFEQAGIAYAPLAYKRTPSRQQHPASQSGAGEALYDTNVICLNADTLRSFATDVGVELFADRYTAGVWFWESTVFPRACLEGLAFVDEVWVASDYVREVIAQHTRKPVVVAPLAIERPPRVELSRADLGLPEGFEFLFSFDFFSVFERKNPLAVIEAFTKAFAPGEGPLLVIKSINGHRKRKALARLEEAARGRPDIRLVDGYLSHAAKEALMATCDCYVSLHRSEGFGLTMAEAMSYGKPVIATGYSGNLEFMDEANSHLVPYAVVTIESGWSQGASWAEPDVDAAAALMRHVYDDQEASQALGERARADILSRLSIERSASFVTARLDEIGRTRDTALATTDVKQAVMRLLAELGSGPARGLGGDERTRDVSSTVRRLLLRALWPGLTSQHRLDTAVYDALASIQELLSTRTAEQGSGQLDSATTPARATAVDDEASGGL